MFNRFFNKKEEPKAASGPPGHHRPSSTGDPSTTGGGFFNLPPPVAARPNASTAASIGAASTSGPPTGHPYPPHPAHMHHGAPPAYASSSPDPQQGRPGFGISPIKQHQQHGHGAAPASSMDMFGGMSLKTPAQAPAPSPAPAPAPGGLFSGLDLAPGGSMSMKTDRDAAPAPAPAPAPSPGPAAGPAHEQRRKSAPRTFNYLEVAAAAGPNDDSATTGRMRTSLPPGNAVSSTAAGATRPSIQGGRMGSSTKKKKKTFRPGFGRQLSEESIAALQRGDLTEEELLQHQQGQNASVAGASSSTDGTSASTSSDLSHLLPSISAIRSGSVLSGLTVHTPTTSNEATSTSGSVLAGLTVHGSATNPTSPSSTRSQRSESISSSKADRVSRTSSAERKHNGILAGLQVHGNTPTNAGTNVEPLEKSHSSTSLSGRAKAEASSGRPAMTPKTPEEKLLFTLRDFHSSAIAFRDSVQRQNEEENRIMERKTQLSNQLAQYEIDLHDVEAQQQRACELEDFEKADALNSSINSVRHCITLTESDLRKVESELTTFLKSKEKAFANQLRSTRGTLKELEKFREDQETEKGTLQEEWKQYEERQSEQLTFEAERIETELSHVQANLSQLTSEKTEIETTIEDQCKVEFALRAELMDEKAGVEEEVRELEARLRVKQDRVRELQDSIDEAERGIDVVRNRFARQLKRIADREEGIRKTKEEVEADAEHLEVEKEQFSDKLQDYETRINAIARRIGGVKKEMRVAVILTNVLEAQETRREQAATRKKQHSAELTALSDAASIAEQSFTMLQKQHDDLEKSMSLHRNAIASAESMIPRLEQDKKNAAAQRNFKEAARISKDIKALEKDRATAEEMIESVEMELQDLKERIAKRDAEYREKNAELQSMEKQLELAALQELWKEARYLRSSIRRMEKCKSEGLAADDGVDFRTSALLLVQAELDACNLQIELLERKHDTCDPMKDQEDDGESEESEVDDEDDHAHARGSSNFASGSASNDAADIPDNDQGKADADLKPEQLEARIVDLEAMIEKATEDEDYDRAALLDEQLESLKRRQHSLTVIASTSAGSSLKVNEAVDDDEPSDTADAAGEESAVDVETLKAELNSLQEQIHKLEQGVDDATEQDDFETAAALDEELESLREREKHLQNVIQDQPIAGEEKEDEDDEKETLNTGETQNDEAYQAIPPMSMFGGLSMRSSTPPSSSPIDSSNEQEEDGEGPKASASGDTSSSPSVAASNSTDLFGGLQVSSERTDEDTVVTSPTVDSADVPGTEDADETEVDEESLEGMPTSAPLELEASAVTEPIPSSSASLFGGLNLGSQDAASNAAKIEHESSTPTGEENKEVHAEKPASDEDVAKSNESSSLFSGLDMPSTSNSEPISVTSDLFGGLTVPSASSDPSKLSASENDKQNDSDMTTEHEVPAINAQGSTEV